ncbi:S26 family signal peptidase [Dactylosporangium sp. NPDC050588]|uniref:S26 family signal peptidase n=1 Tax=Dactylosporangium sp. NPDC050588 TaxID=3157211 RepID=UPI0033CF355F
MSYAVAVALAAGLWFVARRLFGVVVVVGRSMEPSLWAGDRLLVARYGRAVPGRLVVLQGPHGPMVKRVAALPGQRSPWQAGAVVPAGHLLVLGDNAALSHDSRQLGPLPTAAVRGFVLRRLTAAHPVGREPRGSDTTDSGPRAGTAGASAPVVVTDLEEP